VQLRCDDPTSRGSAGLLTVATGPVTAKVYTIVVGNGNDISNVRQFLLVRCIAIANFGLSCLIPLPSFGLLVLLGGTTATAAAAAAVTATHRVQPCHSTTTTTTTWWKMVWLDVDEVGGHVFQSVTCWLL